MKVGIVGCGFIGSEIAYFIDKSKDFQLIGLNDIDKSKVKILAAKLRHKPKFMDLDSLIKNCSLVIESAGKDVVKDILENKNLDKKNKKLLIMSTGGLIGSLKFLNKIKNCGILLPSGAVAGLDAIKSVSGRIKYLTLTTTKPCKSLEGTPYILKNKIDLNGLKHKKIVFEGSLGDAIAGFPQNINVAATLFLASKFNNIKVKIVADPDTKFNSHEIEAVGSFGKIRAVANNLPSKNPRTSYIALLSALQTLKSLKSNMKIGN